MNSLKELILEKIDSFDIFKRYIGSDLRPGRAIKSPLRDGDKHPSFNVYRNKNGKALFKDFAGEEGDVFYFVMLLYNVDFKTAIDIIADDFDIEKKDLNSIRTMRKSALDNLPRITLKKRAVFDYQEEGMVDSDFNYWHGFGIGLSVLHEYGVKKALYVGGSGQEKKWMLHSTDDDPIYFYDYGEGAVRFYRPKNTMLKHFGNVNGSDIFGYSQAAKDEESKCVVICAGQKDCLSLYANTGIRGVSLNSESCNLSIDTFFKLKDLSENLFVCYDNDETGKKHSKKIENEFGITRIDLAKIVGDFKDISDYYATLNSDSYASDPLEDEISKKLKLKIT